MALEMSLETTTNNSNRVLLFSIIFSISLAMVALIFGFLTSSQVILLDGILTLMGVFLTYLSVLAMKFVKKKDLRNYPFGKKNFEPIIVICQYCIILFVSISTIINAIQVILEGGSDANVASGILYGAFSLVFNIGAFTYLKHLTKHNSTPVEEVEVDRWRFGFLFSSAILVGFSVAWILTKTPFLPYTAFVDPVLTVFISLLFIKTAILSIQSCVRELLLATPSDELTSIITEKVNHFNSEHHFSDMALRLGKVGGQLVIEIDYVINEQSELDSILMQDQLRNKLARSLAEVPYEKSLNVNFTSDMRWAGIS